MLISWGGEFQAEGTCAKALRQQHAWHVAGTARGSAWLELHSKGSEIRE